MTFVQRFIKQDTPVLKTKMLLQEDGNRNWLGRAGFWHAFKNGHRAYEADVLVKLVNKKNKLEGLARQGDAPFRADERIADLCFVAAQLENNPEKRLELLKEAHANYTFIGGDRLVTSKIAMARINEALADMSVGETQAGLLNEALHLYEDAGLKGEAQRCLNRILELQDR